MDGILAEKTVQALQKALPVKVCNIRFPVCSGGSSMWNRKYQTCLVFTTRDQGGSVQEQ